MTPLRGREAELARLNELARAACEGAGGVVVVAGAAGIGKSRLLAEAGQRAAAAGLLVAAGGADELNRVTSWGMLLRALAASDPPIMTSADLESLRRLTDQRLAVVERMRAAVEQAAATRPLLIVLDDLQWADPASLLAVGSLPVALFSYPVGWLLALRPWPASPALDGVLERLEKAGLVRLHLGPLSAPDAVALARDHQLTGADADLGQLIADAEGNPFYLLQLLRAAGPEDPGHVTDAVPPRVRAAIARHLRLLSPDARRFLQVASILGREFTVTEVAAMTGQPTGRLTGAVEEALRAEMLAQVPAGLAFRHDLLRQAAYESLPASVRLAMHRDAGEALLRTGAPTVRVAAQLAIGARPGDAAAAAAIGQAAVELTPSSPNAAADLALRALELAGDHDEYRPGLVLSAARALGLAGREPVAEAELQLQLRRPWVIDRLEPYPVPLPASLLTDPAVDPGVAATLAALDQLPNIIGGRGTEADQALGTALRTVIESGPASSLTVLTQLRVLNSLNSGCFGQALARAEAALEAARSGANPESAGIYEEMIVAALAASGRISDALTTMRPALAAANAAGRAGLIFRYRRLRAAMLLSQGHLDDADAEARSVIDLPVELGYPNRVALPLSVIAETALRRGDLAEAHAALTRYAFDGDGVLPDLQWTTALVADARGEAAQAARAFAPIRGQLGTGNLWFGNYQHYRLPQLVHIARRAGEEDAARAFAAAAAHARALIDGDAGLLRKAVERAAASEDRLLEAAAREDLAQALGGGEEAAGQLEAAYDFYVRLGAHRDVARVRAALRPLGIRKQQTSVTGPQHGWVSLTRAEQAVVDLVATGLTNREAASELFLSPDTINTHLRHAFSKLGIRSRVELARLAAERAE